MNKKISIVFPVFNEEDTIKGLVESSISLLEEMPYEYQILIVNNASTDKTGMIIDELAGKHTTVKIVHNPTNLGYAMSTLTGFRKSDGEIVIIIDGDGQHTVADVPAFINKIEAGYDILFGWKEKRYDPAMRKIMSKGLNFLSRVILRYPYNDINCGYRAVTRQVADQIEINHKLNFVGPEIYVWGKLHNCKMSELSVQHFARQAGSSIHIPWALPIIILKVIKYILNLRRELCSCKAERAK
jgi:glycosyltransferase involved in cell wall biosynthesis